MDSGSLTLVDWAGTVHARAAPGARIVSLVPSITELLCDLGLASQLVGRTGFCIHPDEQLRSIAKVGGTKTVKVDRIRQLSPTHLIVNVDENRLETVQQLAQFIPQVIVTDPRAPLDNLRLYRLLGAVFHCQARAEQLCQTFERRYHELAARPRRPTSVLYLIWRQPWMTVSRDTYISRTLSLLGWQTLPARAAARYPTIDLADYRNEVERVLLASEPYRFRDKHIGEVATLLPDAHVSLIDGAMVSWYGSRAIEGLRYLDQYATPNRTAGDARAGESEPRESRQQEPASRDARPR